MESDQRNNLSCSEAGDLIAAGQQLIIAGARLKDGLMIKAGIDHFLQAGWPMSAILSLARVLVEEGRRERGG